MNLAPQALDAAAPSAPSAPANVAPARTPIPDLDRALAELAEHAAAFARTPPREKAALLRAALPRLVDAAPDMAAALGSWFTGPIAAISHARLLAESLEDIVTAGRPALPAREIQKRADGRVIARLAPRSWVERAAQRGRETYVLFEAGVEPEDVIAGQAAFYRKTEPEGGVALVSTVLDALFALFVEGHVALLAIPEDGADLGPILDRALAPLVERGSLRVACVGDEARAHIDAHPAIRLRFRDTGTRVSPLIVVPCLYAKDELTFLAQSIASQLAHGAGPGLLVLPRGWLQRGLFLELVDEALARSAPGWRVEHELDPAAAAIGAPNAIGIVSIGSDDPVEMVAAASELGNHLLAGALAAQIVVHPIHEDEPEIRAAIERAVLSLPCGTVGINLWPALARCFAATPWGSAKAGFRSNARMLARVDKTVIEGPLRAARKPAYFCDHRDARRLAERLAAFAAAPRAGDLWTIAGR